MAITSFALFKCRTCGLVSDMSGFYTHRGRRGIDCRQCCKSKALQWQRDNAEKRRSHGRAGYWRNREIILERLRTGATKRVPPTAEQEAEQKSRRRALLKGARVEKVYRSKVYQRDQGICYICKTPVDRSAFELDHVIPLSRGGAHAYNNVAIAHGACNNRKGAKLPQEIGIDWKGGGYIAD